MEEYRLIIKIKNNLLLNKMKAYGINTQAELARAIDSNPTDVGRVANLKVGAYGLDGNPSAVTIKLCEYFGCIPEDIYPQEILYSGLPKNTIERQLSSKAVYEYLERQELDPLHILENEVKKGFIDQQIKILQPREQKIIKRLYYDGARLRDVALEFDLSTERIRIIESRCLRKIRSTLNYLPDGYDFSDYSYTGLETSLLDAKKEKDAQIKNKTK